MGGGGGGVRAMCARSCACVRVSARACARARARRATHERVDHAAAGLLVGLVVAGDVGDALRAALRDARQRAVALVRVGHARRAPRAQRGVVAGPARRRARRRVAVGQPGDGRADEGGQVARVLVGHGDEQRRDARGRKQAPHERRVEGERQHERRQRLADARVLEVAVLAHRVRDLAQRARLGDGGVVVRVGRHLGERAQQQANDARVVRVRDDARNDAHDDAARHGRHGLVLERARDAVDREQLLHGGGDGGRRLPLTGLVAAVAAGAPGARVEELAVGAEVPVEGALRHGRDGAERARGGGREGGAALLLEDPLERGNEREHGGGHDRQRAA